MKKIFLSAVALTVLSVTSLNAQIKEGYIVYDMKIEGLPPEQAAMFGDMETKVTFKNGKSLSESSTMMGSEQTLTDDKGITTLSDMMGNKIAIKQTKEEIEKEEAKSKDKVQEPKIEYVNETKTIAGYECKKAIVTAFDSEKKEIKFDLWYCEKFENRSKNAKGNEAMFKNLKGAPFEFTINRGPMKVKMQAKEVSLEPVPDSKFDLSTEGYQIKTMEELKAMRGGK